MCCDAVQSWVYYNSTSIMYTLKSYCILNLVMCDKFKLTPQNIEHLQQIENTFMKYPSTFVVFFRKKISAISNVSARA